MALEQAVQHLADVCKSLQEGGIQAVAGDNRLEVSPRPVVDFEMKISRKKDRERLEMSMTWPASSPDRPLSGN
jgi:amphi-Trp domain-containing protein